MRTTFAAAAAALPEAELGALRRLLLRRARHALPDAALAEDLVQDTLIDVLQGAARWRGDASLGTWASAILKHKVADWYRAAARRVTVPLGDDDALLANEVDASFDAHGAWAAPVPAWQQPEQTEERRQLMHALERCVRRLPAQTARVFMMREWLGFETDEIAMRTGLGGDNVRQILHRARMGLRACMHRSWPGAGEGA
jgi:RNA polymerase sigma-70 factor (ECF subfamily)